MQVDPDYIRYKPQAGPPGSHLPRELNESQLREKELEAAGYGIIDGYRGWGPIFYTRDPATFTGSGWHVVVDMRLDCDDPYFDLLRISAGYCIDAPDTVASGSTYGYQKCNTSYVAPTVVARWLDPDDRDLVMSMASRLGASET
jgi:hypothetical protein